MKWGGQSSKQMAVRLLLLTAAGIGLLLFTVWLNRVDKIPLVSREGQTFEKAVVTAIIQDNMTETGTRVGEQVVEVKLLTGEKEGETLQVTSSSGFLFGAPCTPGMKVVVMQSVAGDTVIASVYSQDREWVIYAFGLLYLAVLVLVGGKQGVKGGIGLVFTFFSILLWYLPMVYRGFSPFWSAVFICLITTVVTMLLIGGFTKKTIVATLGTVGGVLTAGIAATLFSAASGISGYNVSDIETLMTLWNTLGHPGGRSAVLRPSDFQPGRRDGCGHVHRQLHERDFGAESESEPEGIVQGRHPGGPGYDGNRQQYADPGLCRQQREHVASGLRLCTALSADHQFQ